MVLFQVPQVHVLSAVKFHQLQNDQVENYGWRVLDLRGEFVDWQSPNLTFITAESNKLKTFPIPPQVLDESHIPASSKQMMSSTTVQGSPQQCSITHVMG